MQKLFLMGEKIFIGAEAINPLQKVVLEELGVARQDNRTNRRARDLLCRGRVRPRRLGLSKVVDVVSNTNHADGQLARANYGRADTTPATVGRDDPTAPQSEDFLWDGLALIQRGDEHFINEPHIGNAPKKLCFGGKPRAKRRARRARKGPRGNPVASSNGTSYFNDALGTTVGSKKDGKYSAAALTAFGENLSVHSPTPTQNSNFFTGKPYVEGLGHAFWMRNYRAGLAKWQTADPMGYPDGWNQLAYCNNGVTSAVDLWGCADVNYFNESSVEWLAAQKFDRNARITVSAHGSHLGITDGNSQKLVSVTELVERIKATDDYKSGIKVVELASCNVGNGAYAQELVNMLGYGFVVYAPDCYASYDHDTGKVTYYKYREQIPWMPETYEKGKLLRFVKE